MRSSILFTAAFAAVALATPVFDKRGEVVVTDNEVVYVTQLVTVTEGQVAPAAPTQASAEFTPWWRRKGRKGRKTRTGGYGQAPAPTSAAPVPSSEEAPAPAPTSYEQPAPQPEPTSEAPAPAPTSYEEPAPAPTSYEQPAPAPSTSEAAPAPAPTGYNPPSGGTATTYQQAVVQHHNYHRANHSAPDIKWSQSLADTALKIAKTCVYGHNMDMDGGNYGQNIAAGIEGGQISNVISNMFYNSEIDFYSGGDGREPDMANFAKWGHATQVVWASTTDVGCATFDCGSAASGALKTYGNVFTVCNYAPAGNMMGAFSKNIGTCKDQPAITGDYNVDYDAVQADAKAKFQ